MIMICLAHCIDKYTKLQVEKFQSEGSSHIQIDHRLEDIVNRMFQRCFDDKKYKQVNNFISLSNLHEDIFRQLVLHLRHVELIYSKEQLKNQYDYFIFSNKFY